MQTVEKIVTLSKPNDLIAYSIVKIDEVLWCFINIDIKMKKPDSSSEHQRKDGIDTYQELDNFFWSFSSDWYAIHFVDDVTRVNEAYIKIQDFYGISNNNTL